MPYYKAFTHDLRSPIHSGNPVWDGSLPFELPEVTVDDGPNECAAGWNFCQSPDMALQIAGLWPTGLPSRIFVIKPSGSPVLERGNKCRSATAIVSRECSTAEINQAIVAMSDRLLQPHAQVMAKEQCLWREVLGCPLRDKAAVESALNSCWPGFTAKEYPSARDAWNARDARDAWDAWDAGDAWAARAAWTAWATRAAWTAWATRAARDARAACLEKFSVLQGWTKPTGIDRAKVREAYRNGAAIVIPTDGKELAYTMLP